MMAVLRFNEFELHISLGAQRSCQISTGREQFISGSTVLLTMTEYLDIELSNFEPDNAMLTGDYL
jgi:hypothetical protein